MKVSFWTVIFFAGSIVVQLLAFSKVYNDNKRLSANIEAIVEGTRYYRIGDSISAARSQQLLLENAEIKKYFPEIRKTIDMMDIKLRQMERYSAVSSTANYTIASQLQATSDERQTMADSAMGHAPLSRYTSYSDAWIDFRQTLIADSAFTEIKTRDSIAIVQGWERPNKLWFIRWGKKKHFQTVVNFNPYSTITYSFAVTKK